LGKKALCSTGIHKAAEWRRLNSDTQNPNDNAATMSSGP
jgi:hypothetical protein